MAGIYLHVPFCHAKCRYCDFYSVARPGMAEAYVHAVVNEHRARRSELAQEPVRTLYFGGGTPSMLEPELFKLLADELYTPEIEEFTIEANPEDVTPEKAALWHGCGVDRVSIGVQSLSDAELRAVGRRHSAADALHAIEMLRKGGIANISADLIYGLPGQTAASWLASMRGLLDTGIEHLSAYCLSYEEGTALWRQREQGLITEATDEEIEERYATLCTETAAYGFEHYEISNFARKGFRSRHNSSYWTSMPYLGLGSGAHSLTAAGLRRYVPSDIKTYIASDGLTALDDPETDTDRTNDLIMTSLRTAEGLNIAALPPTYTAQVLSAAAPWLADGSLVLSGTHLHIPEHHWLIADAIIRELFV